MKPCTPSPWNKVTALLPGAMPRRTDSGSQSGSDSSSAKQKVYLPGLPKVARSMAPGRPPPTLRTMSCSARPIVALARLPWPSALTPLFMPIALAAGPLMMTSGPEKCVVQSRPCSTNSGSSAASSTPSTTGMYSGLQPAITALIATFSTVQGARLGGISPTTSSGLRVGAAQHAQDALVGRRHDRQAVGPAALEAGLHRIVPVADGDLARLQAGIAVARDQRLVHAGLDALGAAARLPGRAGRCPQRQSPASRIHSLALPAHGALDLAAVLEADQRRHGLDVEAERALERVVVEHRAHARREGRIVLADHGQRAGAVEALHHRLDQHAGRTVALGDDDQAVAGKNRIGHSATSWSC